MPPVQGSASPVLEEELVSPLPPLPPSPDEEEEEVDTPPLPPPPEVEEEEALELTLPSVVVPSESPQPVTESRAPVTRERRRRVSGA